MQKLYTKARKLITGKEEGATMAEYGLLLALIAVALVVTITSFKDAIITTFTSATTVLNSSGS